jgi:polyvinyl alcohol dehydrogenase (cytochrome)
MRILALAVLATIACRAQDGEALFKKHCLACHSPGAENRAPLVEALATLSPAAVRESLEKGAMKVQGDLLTPAERQAVASFAGKGTATRIETTVGQCAPGVVPRTDSSYWNGWGPDATNSRFQAEKMAGFKAADVPRLKLKWAFGFPNATNAMAQPTLAGGRLYFGSADGTVYNVDAATGCTYWSFKAGGTVRGAINVGAIQAGRYALLFGDATAHLYAVDAPTGKLLWKTKVEDHPMARITGAPKLHGNSLYAGVSSHEEVSGGNAKYSCCTFRGSLVALDTESGKILWKTYAIPDPPRPTRKNAAGTQLQGPSGAAIWSSPALDIEKRLVYAATGNGYSDPSTTYTDAIIAFRMDDGSMVWHKQMTPDDNWNFACASPARENCPEKAGPDVDIGAPPILRKLADGRRVLLVGQKSAIVHAIDPDAQGKIVWQTRIGRGGALGGVQWGMAADDEVVYVPLSDINFRDPAEGGGLFALRVATGEKVWHTLPPKPACAGTRGCTPAQMAPATLIAGVVFSGSMDGHLRAYDAKTGAVVWDFDTLREFETVNGVKAKGGSLNASGPVIAGGMLYVNSGYSTLGGMGGNVLLAFSVDGK